jgi:hypothetical protein
MTNRENKIKAIISFFEDNEVIFNDCIEELDSWNGYLGDDRYYEMDELSELFCDTDPVELLNRAFFGHDNETWTTDSRGNREYGPFNPNRSYFTFNGYGNLVSANYKDYSDHLCEYFVDSLAENVQHIYAVEDNAELSELIAALTEED